MANERVINDATEPLIDLIGVIVAVTDDEPRVVVVREDAGDRLPSGAFEPAVHDSLEDGLRQMIRRQTGLELFYVEQLYTFGNRFRDAREIDGGPRVVSVAYIALTHESAVDSDTAAWSDWYRYLPWEDWRDGPPAEIGTHIEPELTRWVRRARPGPARRERADRVRTTFGDSKSVEMDAVLALERHELLYEAGLIAESQRDRRALGEACKDEDATAVTGIPLFGDHRRVMATALGRLRGKLAYRPVVFELLPGEFTLLQLQNVAEALSGARLHKQNFRRLVLNADLVEAVGRSMAVGRGRPAELFRFRREVLGEKLTVGLARPVMRRDR